MFVTSSSLSSLVGSEEKLWTVCATDNVTSALLSFKKQFGSIVSDNNVIVTESQKLSFGRLGYAAGP